MIETSIMKELNCERKKKIQQYPFFNQNPNMVLFLPMHLALSCFITNIVYLSVAVEVEVNFITQKLCRNKLFAIYTISTIRLAF